MFPTLSLLQSDSFKCQQMIENMQSQCGFSQKRVVCVHWDQMCTEYGWTIWLCALPHASLPQIAFPHTALSNWIRLWSETATKTSLWIQQAAPCTFVMVTAHSFSVGNKTASNEGKSQHRPDTPALDSPFSRERSGSAAYNSETSKPLHWDTSSEGRGLLVPEDMPVICRAGVHLY